MISKTLVIEQGEHTINLDDDVDLHAVFVGRDKDSLRSKLTFVHNKPHITSRVSIKAVLYDEADFDVEAKLVIEKEATDTDTYLKMKALLIDPHASARAVPSLEIKTDNVKGGHGATIGQIDQQQLYYLMSRGLDLKQAQDQIISAFINS